MPKKTSSKKGFENYILNCVESQKTDSDWTFEDAIDTEAITVLRRIPASKDLRESWWDIRDQKTTGACVGFATADSVLRWHFVKGKKILRSQKTSPRFIWMANKETDEIMPYLHPSWKKPGLRPNWPLEGP